MIISRRRIEGTGRKPFVSPAVVDQGELSDVTRMFSGGSHGKHNGAGRGKGLGLGHGKYGVLGVPGLDPGDFDVDTDTEDV